jgi:hypothetical protein
LGRYRYNIKERKKKKIVDRVQKNKKIKNKRINDKKREGGKNK